MGDENSGIELNATRITVRNDVHPIKRKRSELLLFTCGRLAVGLNHNLQLRLVVRVLLHPERCARRHLATAQKFRRSESVILNSPTICLPAPL